MKISLIVISILLAPAIPVTAGNALLSGLDSLLADTALTNAQIGIAVYDITADSSIYCRDCDKLFTPASNMKLFTSAAALELLGPSYRFKTRFLNTGKIDKKGRIKGDLIIIGGGDPLISGRFRDNMTEVLEFWADSLKKKGIKEIKGDIVVDNSFFSGSEFGGGWSLDDLSYWYACPISALSFNDNCVDLKFLPGEEVGDKAIIELSPQTDYIKITNNAVTVPADSEFTVDYFRIPFTNDVAFFGGIPVDDTLGEVDNVSVHRPDIYCAYIFSDILKKNGIKFKGDIMKISRLKEKDKSNFAKEMTNSLFTWYSDSMGVVISVINKNSQNFFAEQTLKTIGAELGGEGSFKAGLKIVSAFFDSLGIGDHDISIGDGSGLSHYNIVKPAAIIELFKQMRNSPNFETYFESLAIPGVDRSVRKRLEGVEFREYARTKTGSIANTRAFSGYIDGPRTGRLIAFSLMINNYSCNASYIDNWFDSVVERVIAEY